jgi:hypothetical protein
MKVTINNSSRIKPSQVNLQANNNVGTVTFGSVTQVPIQGIQGIQGISGAFVAQGVQGTQGTQGTQGRQGTQGTQGRQGTQGTQGFFGLTGLGYTPLSSNSSITILDSANMTFAVDYDVRYSQPGAYSVGDYVRVQAYNINGAAPDYILGRIVTLNGFNVTVFPDFAIGAGALYASWKISLIGDKGVQGTTGSIGFPGSQGIQGLQGLQGLQGRQGIQGNQGIQGIQGTSLQGVQGPQGIQGIFGIQGRQGIQGNQGNQGIQGRDGAVAAQGIQGPAGSGGGVNSYVTGFNSLTDWRLDFSGTDGGGNYNPTWTINPLSGSFTYWINGVSFTVSSPVTASNIVGFSNFDSTVTICLNTSKNLVAISGTVDFTTHLPIAKISGTGSSDKSGSYITINAYGEEAFLVADARLKTNLRDGEGPTVASGFDISVNLGSGNSDAHAQLGLTNGTFYYAGKIFSITHSNTPVANTQQQKLTFPAILSNIRTSATAGSGTNISYFSPYTYPFDFTVSGPTFLRNGPAGSPYSATGTIQQGQYFTSWIVATKNINRTSVPAMPISFTGAHYRYYSLESADAEKFSDLQFYYQDDVYTNTTFIPLYKIIYLRDASCTNAPKAKIVKVVDVRGLSSLKSKQDIVSSAFNNSVLAANTVGIYTSGSLTLANARINFVNTASVNVSVTPYQSANGVLLANVAFTSVGGGGSGIGYAATARELAIGITIVNSNYEPYNMLRYGADNTGVAGCSDIIEQALNLEKPLYFPGGTYYINRTIIVKDVATPPDLGAKVFDLRGDGSWGNGATVFIGDAANLITLSYVAPDLSYPTPLTPGPMSGSCFYISKTGLYYPKFKDIQFKQFKFVFAWLYTAYSAKFQDCIYWDCNAFAFYYTDAQNPIYQNIGGVPLYTAGPIHISGCTALPADSPYRLGQVSAGEASTFTDGITFIGDTYDTGGGRAINDFYPGETLPQPPGALPGNVVNAKGNDKFDDWFIASILRPAVLSYGVYGNLTYDFPTNHVACRPSGWVYAFVPARNGRGILGPKFIDLKTKSVPTYGYAMLNSSINQCRITGLNWEPTSLVSAKQFFMFGSITDCTFQDFQNNINVGDPANGAAVPSIPLFVLTGKGYASGSAEIDGRNVLYLNCDGVNPEYQPVGGNTKILPMHSAGGFSASYGTTAIGVHGAKHLVGSVTITDDSYFSPADPYTDAPITVPFGIDADGLYYNSGEYGYRKLSNDGKVATPDRVIEGFNCHVTLPYKCTDGYFRRAVALQPSANFVTGEISISVQNLSTGESDYAEYYIQTGGTAADSVHVFTTTQTVNNGDKYIYVSSFINGVNPLSQFTLSNTTVTLSHYDTTASRLVVEGRVSGLANPAPVGSIIRRKTRFLQKIIPFKHDWLNVAYANEGDYIAWQGPDSFAIQNRLASFGTSMQTSDQSLYVTVTVSNTKLKPLEYATAAPTTGKWALGAKIYDLNPTTHIGWVCTAAGTPGTWQQFGFIGAGGSGSQGVQGVQGIQGRQGIQGTQGTQGTQGLQGISGAFVAQGIQGLQGLQGLQGTQGTQGTQGIQGLQGIQGVGVVPLITNTSLAIQTGTRTFTVSLAAGNTAITTGSRVRVANTATPTNFFEGTVLVYSGTTMSISSDNTSGTGTYANWTVSLTGSQGSQGLQGLQGITGSQGIQGVQGIGSQGIQGLQGITGSQGIQGVQGIGSQGIQGIQGTTGPVAGLNTQIIFNDAGTANGSANLTFNSATNALTLIGTANVTSSLSVGGRLSFASQGTNQSLYFDRISSNYWTFNSTNGIGEIFNINGNTLTIPQDVWIGRGGLTVSPTITSGGASANAVSILPTWNNVNATFTAAKINVTDTASGAGSLLMDLQVGGVSLFRVNKLSTVFSQNGADTGGCFSAGSNGFRTIQFGSTSFGSNGLLAIRDGGVTVIRSGGSYSWESGTNNPSTGTVDLSLFRDAAGTLAQRVGTANQTFRIYNTYTDASNYERATIGWSGNVLQIGTANAGTGLARSLELQTDGTTRLTISSGTSGITSATGVDFISGGGLQLAGTYQIRATSRARLSFPADGVITLNDWAATSFSRLQFGGTTSAFPSLKRNGTVIQARLADDSGDAGFSAANISLNTASSNTSSIAANGYNLLSNNATSMVDLDGTWNTTGTPTAFKLNITDTASASTSLLMDLRANNSSKFSVDKIGNFNITSASIFTIGGNSGFSRNGNNLLVNCAGSSKYNFATSSFISINPIGFGTDPYGADVFLVREAANTLAQRNGVNAQIKRIYATYTDASNYARIFFDANGGGGSQAIIGAEGAGTGVNLLNLTLKTGSAGGTRQIIFNQNGSDRWKFDATSHFVATTDNAYDIGASGANRPRNVYVAGSVRANTFVSDTGETVGKVTNFVSTNTNYTMTATNEMVIGTGTVPITITLPNAANVKSYYFQNSGNSTMTLQTVSSQLINNDTTLVLRYTNSSCMLISDGTKFYVL